MAGTALVSPPDKDNVPLVSKKQLNKKYQKCMDDGDINWYLKEAYSRVNRLYPRSL